MSVIRTVRDRNLSLWQSAVEEVVHKELSQGMDKVRQHHLLAHPMMQAVNEHVQRAHKGEEIEDPDEQDTNASAPKHTAAISKLRHDIAEAKRTGSKALEALQMKCRKFATCDLAGWATCETIYLKYFFETKDTRMYIDWEQQSGSDINFGVIDYRLPNDGKVALIADWGTGLDDAQALLEQVINDHDPAAIIHLGDVYYGGTPAQNKRNFLDVFDEAFGDRPRVPVFNMTGNHDYYDFGLGFYQGLKLVNSEASWEQKASYFCLRTEDDQWQFLAMDTGYDDHNPIHANHAPKLQPSEVAWHQHKLETFDGRTILLSHHQLYSTYMSIQKNDGNFNEALYEVFHPYFDRIPAWFWGHEHNLVLYENDYLGLPKGRLIGCGAYEETTIESPYKQYHPQVKYLLINGRPVTLGVTPGTGYYNHGYAVIDLKRDTPDAPVHVSYFQLPSWNGTARRQLPPEQPYCLATEAIG